MADDPSWIAYTALGLSVISTLRPEIESAYYRYVKPATAAVDLLSQITLGVNTYGPYVQLSGVVTVSHGTLLIRRMSVKLERDDASAEFDFASKFYVGTQIDSQTSSPPVSMPIPFSVDDGKPTPFSAVFVSTPDARAFEHALLVLRDAWATYSADQSALPTYPGQYAPAQDPWGIFRKDSRFIACVQTLCDRSFWIPGRYRFLLEVETSGKSPRIASYAFTLAQDDVARIVASISRIPDSTFGYGDPRLAWTALTQDTETV